MLIRSVTESDAAAVNDLLNPIIDTGMYSVMTARLTLDDQLEFIRLLADGGVYMLAVDDDTGEALGVQEVIPGTPGVPAFSHVGEIGTFVRLGMHRSGVGSALCEATFDAARRQGLVKLRATIRADNPGALAFYAKQGFKRIGVAENHAFVNGRYIDEVLMERFIEETIRR